jgi:uncharacterized protein involved in copper resistance
LRSRPPQNTRTHHMHPHQKDPEPRHRPSLAHTLSMLSSSSDHTSSANKYQQHTTNRVSRDQHALITMDHSHHAGMDHGHMDHGDMGSEPMCSMNVSSAPPPLCSDQYSSRKRTDAIHLGHDKPLHSLPQLARDRHFLSDLVSDRRRGADGRLRSHPRSIAALRGTSG